MNRFDLNFKDKVCFVTGAASGIGRATALAFARSKARLVCIDQNEKLGLETVSMIKDLGSDVEFFKTDISLKTEVNQSIHRTLEKFGRIDIAFNNAGIEGTPASTLDCSEENWDRVLGVNLKGTWLCMKKQIEVMLKQGGGAIVNCSSIAGLVGFQNSPAYVSSKHGMIGLTKTAALEYAKSNIRINAVCPGVIQTAMIDRFVKGNEALLTQLSQGEPMGRLGEPDEIASAVLWLCSDGASFVTGQALAVDGGWVAQ